MGTYAAGTTVSVSKSLDEIQTTLKRFKCSDFGYLTGEMGACIMFRREGISYRMAIELPDPSEKRFWWSPAGKSKYTAERAAEEWQKEVNRLWRCLALLAKAKLVAANDGIVDFETEFLPYAMLANGKTVAEHAMPAIESARQNGSFVMALPGPVNP